MAVTPCGANNAPATCAANSLGTLDLHSGTVTPVAPSGPDLQPSGVLYVGPGNDQGNGPGRGGDQGGDGNGGA